MINNNGKYIFLTNSFDDSWSTRINKFQRLNPIQFYSRINNVTVFPRIKRAMLNCLNYSSHFWQSICFVMRLVKWKTTLFIMNFWNTVKPRIRTTAAPNWTLTLIHPFSSRYRKWKSDMHYIILFLYIYIYRKKKKANW